jgi:hypothetical protein
MKIEIMKKTLQTILIMVGAALATSVAQANYILSSAPILVDTLLKGHGTALPASFTVTSKVLTYNGVGPNLGKYEYTYTISTIPAGQGLADEFEVSPVAGVVSFVGAPTPVGWTPSDAAGVINWNSPVVGVTPVLLPLGGLTYGFFSPLPPANGGAGAEDGTSWTDNKPGDPGVNVPGAVPDGGLTASLLGGGLLGLAALRRKIKN